MSTDVETDAEPRPPVTVTHAPARLSAGMAMVAALLAVITSAASFLGLLVGAFGLVGLAVGLFAMGSRGFSGLATGIVFAGVVANGLVNADEVLIVFGGLASILAFDFTQNAFGVGHQMTADTETWRGEIVHAAGSVAVGAIAVVVSFGIYSLMGGELAVVGLVFLFLSAIMLIWAIRA